MKKIFYAFILSLAGFAAKAGVYSTPGTGVNWTLTELVANSGGFVTFDGSAYTFTDSVTIRTGDVVRIENNVTVKFNAQVVFRVNGSLIVNPSTGVLFTAANTANPFRGVWVENSTGSSFKKLTYEYASSFRLSDASPSFEDCIFRYNNSATTLSNGTLSLFRSNPVVTHCSFINNYRSAIQGGANIANAPKIYNCTFIGNNSSNQNVPHINLGASGTDTTKIIGCSITNPGGIRTGAIGFLPLGTLNVLIENNHIANNRYGVSLQGGADISSMVRYNYIGFNNIENNPNLGGSGIAYAGGTATSQQKSIVTGNIFEGNLWGITIQNRSKPNIGNLSNTDTSDNGKNVFINNTNAGVPFIDLYNNSIDTIYAQNNFWNSENATAVESKIFHRTDQASLGPVLYTDYATRFNFVSLTAAIATNDVQLKWRTNAEYGTRSFVVEKSFNNISFQPITTVAAKGISFSPSDYDYLDVAAFVNNATIYYRLKMTDTSGAFRYSDTVSVKFPNIPATGLEQYYPTILNNGQPWTIKINSPYHQPLRLNYFTADGKLVKFTSIRLVPGFNQFVIPTDPRLPQGWIFIKVSAIGLKETVPVLIH
ncbi:MAG: hypothetical protein QM687_01920 [Ferruginibacter sp.]